MSDLGLILLLSVACLIAWDIILHKSTHTCKHTGKRLYCCPFCDESMGRLAVERGVCPHCREVSAFYQRCATCGVDLDKEW
jgi:hypothetical protein